MLLADYAQEQFSKYRETQFMAKSRGKLFVDSVVQGALVKRLIAHWLTFFSISLLCLFAMESMLGDPSATLGNRVSTMWQKYGVMILIMFATLPMFVYDTIKLSHRFAGPIYRLRTTFKTLANGEPAANIKFREQDFWTDMATDFNVTIERLNASEQRVAELELAAAGSQLSNNHSSVGSETPSQHETASA